MTFKQCIYCGSMCHSNEDCRSPSKAQTMQSLYGSTNIPMFDSKPADFIGLPANVVHSMDAAIHNAVVFGTGAMLDGVSIDPADMYEPTPDEVTAAMYEADQMNFNLRTYGTIDKPVDPLMKIIEAAYHCAWSYAEIHAAVKAAGLDEISDETIAMLLGQHHDSI